MPYIPQKDRSRYFIPLSQLVVELNESDWNVGHVNYVISSILFAWFKKRRSYTTINAIIGVLGCVWSEFYRVKAIDYEEIKKLENGELDLDNEILNGVDKE